MILRRLVTAIRKQDWFTVLIETLIVVLGVFLGIQLGNWNEARVEVETGESYLSLVGEELVKQAETYHSAARRAEQAMERVERIIEVTADPETVRSDPEAFVSTLYYSRYRSYLPPPVNVYSGLEASGNISLIQEDAVLERIRDHYAEVELWNDVFGGTMRVWHNYTDAITGYLTADQMAATLEGERRDNAEPLITEEAAVALARRLASDPDLMRWLPAIHDYHHSSKLLCARMGDQAASLAAEVRDELGEGPAR